MQMMMALIIMMMRVNLLMAVNDRGEHEDGVDYDGNDNCDSSNDGAGGDISNDNVAVVVPMMLMITKLDVSSDVDNDLNQDEDSWTALHAAAANGHHRIAE